MDLSVDDIEEIKNKATFKAYTFPLARYINQNDLLNAQTCNSQVASNFFEEINLEKEYKAELHPVPLETHSASIENLIKTGEYLSAAILIAVSLEEDINGFMRLACCAKGFTHKKITNFISETSIKTKIDLIFPLLGVQFPEQYRTAIFEYLPIRNSAVHGKAIPSFLTSEQETLNSVENNQEKAQNIISTYPINKLQNYSNSLYESLIEIPELQYALEVLHEYVYE